MDFASRATLIPGTLLTLNLPIKIHPSSDSFVFSDVNLVSNYQSYKEKTIKLLPYHSFYRGHIAPQEKLSPLFWQSTSKNKKTPGCQFSSVPLKIFLICHEVCNIPH